MKKRVVPNLWWITLILSLIMLITHGLSLDVVKVDNTTIILLLVIALSPFISAVTKIKFGDFEAEIDPKEVQKIRDEVSVRVTNADKTKQTSEIETTVNAMQRLVDSDPVLALAKLRIELEKALNKLYRMTHAADSQRRPMGAGQLAYSLSAAEILPRDIAQSIGQVISICNRAIHGEEIRSEDAKSVVDVGTTLLYELNLYIFELVLKPVESTEIDQETVDEFLNAQYQVTMIVPLVKHPRKEIRIVDQEGLDELLEGYEEYAEFVVGVTKVDIAQKGDPKMARFGGNEFTGFSVPLAFEGRYFILEPGDPPQLTVVKEQDGVPIFEVLRNEPMDNPFSDVTKTPPGILTVSDKQSGRFLYKTRPASETSVVFGMLEGSEMSARITDRTTQVGGVTLENNVFQGELVGVQVTSDGRIAIGAPMPPVVREWLKS